MEKSTKHLIAFFAATFVWTWAFYAPMAIGHHNPTQMPWLPLYILGGMGPSVIGIAMLYLTGSPEQRRDFWRRSFSCRRIGARWWALIFLIFPLIFALSIALDSALGGPLAGMEKLKALMANPLNWPLAAFISFMSGPWSEEFGWRGYALDRILKPLGIIYGSTVLGVVWGVWHLPLYFMDGIWHAEMGFQLAGFWTFVVGNAGLSLLMTWVYLNTRRSILSGMLLHFAINFSSQLVAPVSDRVEIVHSLLMLAVGLAACLLMERRRRSAGQTEPPRLAEVPG